MGQFSVRAFLKIAGVGEETLNNPESRKEVQTFLEKNEEKVTKYMHRYSSKWLLRPCQ